MAKTLRILETPEFGWDNLGSIESTAAEADISLADTERWIATLTGIENAVVHEVKRGQNKIEVRFLMVTENHTADIEIWGVRHGDNNLTRICTLDVICGDQNHSDGVHQFADTINISNEKWDTDVSVIANTDTIARLYVDVIGYDRIFFHGFGTFDGYCIVECSGY